MGFFVFVSCFSFQDISRLSGGAGQPNAPRRVSPGWQECRAQRLAGRLPPSISSRQTLPASPFRRGNGCARRPKGHETAVGGSQSGCNRVSVRSTQRMSPRGKSCKDAENTRRAQPAAGLMGMAHAAAPNVTPRPRMNQTAAARRALLRPAVCAKRVPPYVRSAPAANDHWRGTHGARDPN